MEEQVAFPCFTKGDDKVGHVTVKLGVTWKFYFWPEKEESFILDNSDMTAQELALVFGMTPITY